MRVVPALVDEMARVAQVLVAVCALALGTGAQAQCSKTLVVPVAPTGFNVIVEQDRVSGVYPDLLRSVAQSLNCKLDFPVVPRARAEAIFFRGDADVFIPSSQTSERDAKARFVHLLNLTPSLVTFGPRGSMPEDMAGLLNQTSLRATFVRTYSWGDAYDDLLRKLEARSRVDYVVDLLVVGRMLKVGRTDFTILPATLLFSALNSGTPDAGFGGFQYTRLRDLPRSRVGAYLSTQSLTVREQDALGAALLKAATDGTLKRILEKYYPADILKADIVFLTEDNTGHDKR